MEKWHRTKRKPELSTLNEIPEIFPLVIPHLERIYSSIGEGNYLLGIKMQLIPIISNIVNQKTKSKVYQLSNRSARFNRYIIQIIKWEIAHLDIPKKSDGRTLMQMIMFLRLQENIKLP